MCIRDSPNAQASDQPQESRPQQLPAQRSQIVVTSDDASAGTGPESDSTSEHEAGGEDSTGGKRWRGRRRRRGGRGSAGSQESQSGANEAAEGYTGTGQQPTVANEIQAGSTDRSEPGRSEFQRTERCV